MASSNKRKAQRVRGTTPDSMALYAAGGLVLVALGVLILLATVAGMTGEVFAGLRGVTRGLAGGMTLLLPAVLIWGGVLLLLATQRAVKSGPYWLFCLLALLAMTAVNLFSTSGAPPMPLMDYFASENLRSGLSNGFDVYLARGWETGAGRGMGGGLLGMLLAWPLWAALGSGVARVLTALGIAADCFFLCRIRPQRIAAWFRERAQRRANPAMYANQMDQQAQDVSWQQRQSLRQQAVSSWDGMVPQDTSQTVNPAQTGAPWRTTPQPAGPVPQDYGFKPTDNERYARPGAKSARKEDPLAEAAEGAKRKRKRLFTVDETEEKPQPVPDAGKQQRNETPYNDAVQDRTDRIRAVSRKTSETAAVEPAVPAVPAPAGEKRSRRAAAQQTGAELLPWEGEDRFGETPDPAPKTKVPRLQTEAPEAVWKPELNIPQRRKQPLPEEETAEAAPYVYPPLDLLKPASPQSQNSEEEDAMRAQRLEETLESFKVPAKVRHVTHGPAISRFELEIAAGIKVSKITDLGKNIAMNMEVKSVRIEAPIPGKSLVGVEVPNRKVATVTLREVLDSECITSVSPQKAPLLVALGKDIAGTPVACNLARMPHLLIAGATGSGKSVCINAIINSLLYRTSPKEVRMIMVDPKVVELQCYNGIPHLLIPVVSEPHKAAGALAWAVAEMMDRYKKFQKKGVRAIDSYNASLDEGEEFMPRIVIIIDELADLMMTCKREVEEYICRLAQLARAAGLHLIVATQRPSVDVITGLIKANIPSRIAFKVSSNVDSRTILDHMGAEQLLGWGDMLYMPTGEFTPSRLQGCFLSDDEVNNVTEFIRAHSEPDYDPGVLEQLDQIERETGGGGMPALDEPEESGTGDETLLSQAIEMAVTDGQVSTSVIQRRLKIGYARAGRLVDEMERRGIVSAKDGAKPRLCLITRDEFERMKREDDLTDEEQ